MNADTAFANAGLRSIYRSSISLRPKNASCPTYPSSIYIGGCIRAVVEQRRIGATKSESDRGTLATSGLVAADLASKSTAPRIPGIPGDPLPVGVILLVSILLYYGATAQSADQERPKH